MAAPSNSKPHCYILKKTTQGEKDVTAGLNSNDNGYHKILSLMGIQKTNVEVSRGEFVQPAPNASASFAQMLKYHILRDTTISFSCFQADVAPLTLRQYEYLNRSEVIPDKRYTVYEHMLSMPDIVALTSGEKIGPPLCERPASFAPSCGEAVLVPSYGPFGSSYYGVVKWIGQFDGREETMAGIELVSNLDCINVICHLIYIHIPQYNPTQAHTKTSPSPSFFHLLNEVFHLKQQENDLFMTSPFKALPSKWS